MFLPATTSASSAMCTSYPKSIPYDDAHLRQIFQYYSLNPDEMVKEIHRYAASLLDKDQVQQAWQVLLMRA